MIKGNLTNECADKFNRISRSKNQKMLIQFKINAESGCTSSICQKKWSLKEDSIKLKQVNEPWWNNVYHDSNLSFN